MNILSRIRIYFEKISSKSDSFFSNSYVKKALFALTVLLSFALIYMLNVLQPLFGDDWSYGMASKTERLSNFGQILEAQYHHYFDWGGRTIVHIIAQTLLLAGDYGDLLNSLGYVAFTIVIYLLAKRKDQHFNVSLLISINMLLWFFQPAYAQTFLWITGSANYLWGTLIILSFLIPYKRYLIGSGKNDSYIKSVLMFILGIIAGWTNENTTVALAFMLFVFICYIKASGFRTPKWTVTGLIGNIIGAVFLIAAPGNYERVKGFAGSNDPVIIKYFHQFINAIASFYYYSLPLVFIFLLVFVIYRRYKITEIKKDTLFMSVLAFGGAIIATLSMSASPFFPGRASFGINTLVILAISILYASLNIKDSLVKGLAYISILFALLFFSADYYRGYKELIRVDKIIVKRMDVLETLKQKGEKDIILEGERINSSSRFLHYWDLMPYPQDWNNQMFSNYYGINSVTLK